MSIANAPTRRSATLAASFSFYVTTSSHERIQEAAQFGDAVTVAGPKGPDAIIKLRASGFDRPVLFDGMGYAAREHAPAAWVGLQQRAGADRTLLPGVYIPWDKNDTAILGTTVAEQGQLATSLNAGVLLAVDSRWIAKQPQLLGDALLSTGQPAALVLAHPGDPLSVAGAVAGLRLLAQRVPHLSILRGDHGAIGAVALGAAHASIGLTTSTRHFVATSMSARRVGDKTARVFLRRLLDWFRAAEVAGWSAAGANIICNLGCCKGESVARYLDEDLDATWHNMHALADLADYVLNADPNDRIIEFLNECRSAVARYGLAGFRGPEKPKAQLTNWVFS